MLSLLPVEILLKVCSCLSFKGLVRIERVEQRLRYVVKEQLFKDVSCRVRKQIRVDTEVPEGTRVYFCLKSNRFTPTHITVANGSRCTSFDHKISVLYTSERTYKIAVAKTAWFAKLQREFCHASPGR